MVPFDLVNLTFALIMLTFDRIKLTVYARGKTAKRVTT